MLTDPVGQAETLERQLFEIVAFLRSRELLHMDGHFGNIRADDDRIYLVDFGLATSPRFDLSFGGGIAGIQSRRDRDPPAAAVG